MVQLVGTYKFESQENYKEYLISLGVDEEKASKINDLHEDSVISAVDANSITALYGGQSVKYPLNKELEYTLPTGNKVWTTATIDGNVVTFKTKLNAEGTLVDEKVLTITDYGVIITSLNTKGVTSVRKYKRAIFGRISDSYFVYVKMRKKAGNKLKTFSSPATDMIRIRPVNEINKFVTCILKSCLKMVKIDGTYEFLSQENYKEYLISLGLKDEQATKLSEFKGNVVIHPVEGDTVTVEYTGHTVTFPLNKELEHGIPSGHKHWTTTTVNDDGITFKTKHTEDGSISEEKVFKVFDNGLTVTSTNTKGVNAVRQFRRI